MPPARFQRFILTGFMLLGACNDTRDLAPASPDTPWQFEPSKEAPTAPAPAFGAKRVTVPENTAVELPSPAEIGDAQGQDAQQGQQQSQGHTQNRGRGM